MDYSWCNQPFVDGLYTFLEYTDPDPSKKIPAMNSLAVRRCIQEKEFEKRCIQRWAISELIEAILSDPEHSVEDISYRFALKLCSFAINAPDEGVRNVFNIAADFIEKEVIGIFKKEEGMYP